MQKAIAKRLKSWEVALRNSFGKDITTPGERWKAVLHFHLFDHAFLRILWTNFYPIGEDVYRSNQPDRQRLKRMKDLGVRTIINLRGASNLSHYLFEKEACDALGLTLVNVPMHARQAMPRRILVQAIDAMRDAERPVLMHCKSGADRAGLASAIYKLVFDGASPEEALKQLSWKYVHLERTKTGICGQLIRSYAARAAKSPIAFEDWVRTEYDPVVLTEDFEAWKAERAS